MRIISGEKRGLKLLSPIDYRVRPTTDKIKESIFNILSEIDENSIVLDLFRGSGAIGIEFISRGAKKVYFCDFSNDSIKVTKKNIESTNFVEKSVIIKNDYMECLKYFFKNNLKFDYIFLDPPYKNNYIENTLEFIWDNNILNENGIIILETDKNIIIKNFIPIKEKKYSKIRVIFLERK